MSERRHVGVPEGWGASHAITQAEGAEIAARALRVRLEFVEARGPGDIDSAFSNRARVHVDGLTVLSSTMLFYQRQRLANLAAKNRLPTVFSVRAYADAGGLMSYGPKLADLFRRAATHVARS